MTNALDILVEARGLIADEDSWTQNGYARNAYGTAVHPTDPTARSWCAMGAIEHVGRDSIATDDAQIALSAVALKQFTMAPAAVNDRLGHHSVMSMFDTAIDKLEESSAPDDEAAA